jgi:lysocardiolipin and lysophospholipid acyltransferase
MSLRDEKQGSSERIDSIGPTILPEERHFSLLNINTYIRSRHSTQHSPDAAALPPFCGPWTAFSSSPRACFYSLSLSFCVMVAEHEPTFVPKPTPAQRVLGAAYGLSVFFMFYILTLFLVVPAAIFVFPFNLELYRRWLGFISHRAYHYLSRWKDTVLGTRYVCWVADSRSDPRSSDELLMEFSQPGASGMVVFNHRTRLDWLLAFPFFERWGRLQNLRIILKDVLMMIPGVGWTTQFFGFLFLKRSWETDKKHMEAHLTHLMNTNGGYPVQLLVYPEGTDLSEENRVRSHAYSEKVGLPKYHYVMHPRVSGFVLAQKHLRTRTKGCWVITQAYPEFIPQNESLILSGCAPSSVHFYFQYYDWTEVPGDDEGAAVWIQQRFAEMETRLESFYKNGGKFDGASPVYEPPRPWHMQPWFAFTSWHALWMYTIWLVFTQRWAFWWFVVSNALCLVATHVLGGFDKIELRWWGRSRASRTE